ncbi:hypothetical protein Cni_G14962 [Canna indica]|uniref:Uncharacterized protein n=1 Tax=Canna indica TaxID=4628 RepID=A0AAQ3KF82_9LILI|nr:hypothetical protein Cni_G14962 [Canna indica]
MDQIAAAHFSLFDLRETKVDVEDGATPPPLRKRGHLTGLSPRKHPPTIKSICVKEKICECEALFVPFAEGSMIYQQLPALDLTIFVSAMENRSSLLQVPKKMLVKKREIRTHLQQLAAAVDVVEDENIWIRKNYA